MNATLRFFDDLPFTSPSLSALALSDNEAFIA
jgi:hypothetical protein